MISRYIVINAILFIPLAVYQIFNFRRYIAVSLLAATIVIYFIWCFYYPQAYREDTYEVGYMLQKEFAKGYDKGESDADHSAVYMAALFRKCIPTGL